MKFKECIDLTPDEDQFFLLCLHVLVGRCDIVTIKKMGDKNPQLFKQYLDRPMVGSGKTLLMTALSTSCVEKVVFSSIVRDEFSEKDDSEFKTKKEKKAAMEKRLCELLEDENLFVIALKKIQRKLVKYLVDEWGPKLLIRDALGRTCLFDAVQSNDKKLVVYILNQFCDATSAKHSSQERQTLINFVNIKDNKNQTAYDFAKQKPYDEFPGSFVIEELLRLASTPDTLDEYFKKAKNLCI